MKTNNKTIYVYADWDWLPETCLLGVLTATVLRGKEVFSFEYNAEWLNSPFAKNIDPELSMFSGRQYLNESKPIFGIFSDSAPDRWGRILMKRREAVLARQENRNLQNLRESDFLLGVYDDYRSGALRFKTEINGSFLNSDQSMATPPWTALGQLELAVYKMQNEEDSDSSYFDWINLLIAPGSSIGGARPKANIIDSDNNLWIAKFPSKNDEYDVGAWETVANELAVLAGININPFYSDCFYSNKKTFLTKRFDRNNSGKRKHFASAMTLLGYNDGNDYKDGISYLEIAEYIIKNGAFVENDLLELYRRIVFSVCISNSDDHLRNHGFILTSDGWQLSPAYDLNPVPFSNGLSLNISEDDNTLDINLVKSVHKYFRLSSPKAYEIINDVQTACSKWEEIAIKNNIQKSSRDFFRDAFKESEKV